MGPGGVAFLHPESSVGEKAYMCLYRITLEQFNDVFCFKKMVQVMRWVLRHLILADLQTVQNQGSISLEVFKGTSPAWSLQRIRQHLSPRADEGQPQKRRPLPT
ncbi:hypothetical protein GH714_043862 [Hevea brasiliensis]|uniref:Uncharacterized protein n=1 Tax=Hevea brasiliensis TaxID=3981 RepID=A0A6A6K1Y7_HEVBR|nr:hypothetical protein GH714_043862 [Hevea brasiliensis]